MQLASATLGLPLGLAACRASRDGEQAALWLGPDERLLLGPDGSAEQTAARLQQALAGEPHSLVDVSHRQVGLLIETTDAAALLNAGCALDLHPTSFPIGACTRTLLGRCEIVLWRTAQQRFHLEVWRSFAHYVAAFIAAAARDIVAPD